MVARLTYKNKTQKPTARHLGNAAPSISDQRGVWGLGNYREKNRLAHNAGVMRGSREW